MIPFLILIQPLDRDTNQRTNVRLGSAADATVLGLGGVVWESAIARRPRIAMDLMTPEIDGRFQFATADFVIAGSQMREHDPERMFWKGAPVWIYRASDVAADRTTLEFRGLVREEETDLDSGRITLNLQVDIGRLDKPLLTKEFTGGGGLAGEPEMRGTLLPLGMGYNENIDILMFDKTNNIAMLDGYGNLQQIHNAFEGGNDLGPSVGDYGNYAGLRAAILNKTIVPGRWGTALADGLLGYGAPLVGIPTVHATFAFNRTGQMMRRWCESISHAAVPTAEIDLAAFASLDTVVDREVRFHTSEQVQISTLIERFARACNATPLVTPQNMISITRATKSPALLTLNRNGQVEPRVTDWREIAPIDPVYRVVLRGARPGRVMGLTEVSYADTLIDRGVYNPAETYRDGNLVYLADKSQWLYRFGTPTSGNAPPTGTLGNAYWIRRQAPTSADNITYADGTAIEALKPGEAGANVTETRTATAITGQGAFATISAVDRTDPKLTGFGALAGQASLWFGSPYLLQSVGGLIATLSGFRTDLGIASGFLGQGWGATALQSLLDNRVVALGQNVVVNSSFKRGLYGFEIATGVEGSQSFPVASGLDLSATYYGIRHVGYTAVQTSGAPWNAGNAYCDAINTRGPWRGYDASDLPFTMPVRQGNRAYVQALLARHRCMGEVFLLVFDKGGTLVQSASFQGGRIGGAVNGDPKNFDPVGGYVDVTAAAAAQASLMIRMSPNRDGGGQDDPHLFYTDIQMGLLASDQTALPVYVDGPADPLANRGGTFGVDLFGGGVLATNEAYKTALGTAAALFGQGTFATQSFLDLTNGSFFNATGRFAAIDNGDANFFRAQSIVFGSNQTSYRFLSALEPQEGGANATEGRTASGIAGQGALATRGSVNMGDGTVTGKFAENLVYGFNNTAVSDLRPEEAGGNRTEQRTSAAFVGQSSWATYTGLAPVNVAGQVQGLQTDGNMQANRIYKPGVAVLGDVFPEEANANRTETRTASAIAGQGAFATAGQISSGNVASYFNFSAFKLDYSITRSDGVNVVTENLVVTTVGVSAGFSGQGSLATLNQADTGNLVANAATQTAGVSFDNAQTTGSFTTYVDVASTTVNLASTGYSLVVFVDAFLRLDANVTSGNFNGLAGRARLLRNGVEIASGFEFTTMYGADGGDAYATGQVSICKIDLPPGAGNYTYTVQVAAFTGTGGNKSVVITAVRGSLLPIIFKR